MSKFTKGLPNSPGYYFCCRNEKEKDILHIIKVSKIENQDSSVEIHYKSYDRKSYPFLLYGKYGYYTAFSIITCSNETIIEITDLDGSSIKIKTLEIQKEIYLNIDKMLFSKIEIPRD